MPMPTLFPFGEYWWFYAGFLLFVMLLLALDLGVFHRKAHTVSFREAGAWALVWVSLALVFNFALYHFMLHRFPDDPRLMAVEGFDVAKVAKQTALEFLTGYIVEYSLSVDNIFVFVVVMSYFSIPGALQHRVLFFGILGALVFRGIFIAIGSLLMQLSWMIFIFGGFLILTGLRFIFMPEKEPNPEKNAIINLFKKYVRVTHKIEGPQFFVKVAGVLHATPLFITLLFLEMTDIVFAVDSVPAIFALTREPLIVFTSNIFAILGLRNLYFLLSGAMDKFYMLKYGLGIVLIFVGLKMVWLNELYGGHFPIVLSLSIILGVIAASVALSLIFPKRSQEPQ